MLTVTPGHSAGYLTNQVGAGMESYYTGAVGAGEPPGRWHGKGAELLGLAGEVDADVMSAMYERYLDPTDTAFADPGTRYGARTLGRPPKEFRTPDQIVGERIREYTAEHASTPSPEQIRAWQVAAEKDVSAAAHFYDLTFSPDKSVTVLWTALTRAASEAGAAGDDVAASGWQWAADQVEEAVMEASAAGLDYVERTAAFTRTGRHGARSVTGHWADTQGMTTARFLQHTSRENDPQIHVHQAVFSKVQTPDGRWLALDGKILHAARAGVAAISEREMEASLTRRLGIEWEMREDGIGRRVVGVDPALEDLFSSRSRAIGPEAERRMDAFEAMYGRIPNAIERRRILQAVTLATRPGKTSVSESPAEMNERWHAEAGSQVAGGLSTQARRFQHILDRYSTTRDLALAGTDGAETSAATESTVSDGSTSRPSAPAPTFSVRTVIAEALEACHGPDGKSTFNRHDLIRQINLALPDDLGALAPGQAEQLLEQLADEAMASVDVVQVAGLEIGRVPDAARLADGTADTVNPAQIAYATRGHLSAEWAVLRSAGEHGRTALPRFVVEDWLDAHPAGQALSPAQREALLGLATSDAAAAVLVGPAGTGKSFTAAAFDAAWRDLTTQLAEHRNPDVSARYGPGRAVGVAITQAAADVLAEDGVTDSANIAAFLTAQRRLAEGRPVAGDERWRLGPHDVLLVDEASMADTASLNRLQTAADTAGARVVLMGDPHQLGPVGAGGMMRAAIDRNAQTFTLNEVRRFTHDWEATASLRLRDGHADAVTDYDAHGRLIDAGREHDAIAAIARAAAADRLAGKDTVVITASNEHAAQVAAAVRRHLADVGHVGEASILLDRDGTTAGVGDLVQARRIDRQLGLVNREVYRIDAVDEHGNLTATSTRTGTTYTIPADYATVDLSLAYASTAHGAQGRTVDTSHLLLTPTSDRAGAYVGLTRGRESNTAWAITDTGIPNPDAPTGTTVHTARGLLARALSTETNTEADGAAPLPQVRPDAAAVDIRAADQRIRRDAGTLLGLIEDETRFACRTRLETQLDRLAGEGLLTDSERARFGAEQGTEHLAKLLRAHEQAGRDPYSVLRDGVMAGDFAKANALSQVVAARIDKRVPLEAPMEWTTPTGSAASETSANDGAALAAEATTTEDANSIDERSSYLEELRALYGDRQRQLGEDLADQAEHDPEGLPGWVQKTLGPLPSRTGSDGADTDLRQADAEAAEDFASPPVDAYASTEEGMTREVWMTRAGAIAAQREAAGWTNPDVALGRCPGVSTPEKRAAWHAAYTAAGMPEERRPEAEMTDGRLLVRARAAERAAAHAPAVVYDAQRERHRQADAAARDAVLARTHGRDDDAAQLEATAAAHLEAARRLDEIAESRAHWLLAHTETIAAGEAARTELVRRGVAPGTESDRVTVAEWLEAEARARVEDDAHRTITEDDLAAGDTAEIAPQTNRLNKVDRVDDTHVVQPDDAAAPAELAAWDSPPVTPEPPKVAAAEATVGGALSAAAAEAEISVAAAHARKAAEALADQASQDNSVAGPDNAVTQEARSGVAPEADANWEADRSRQIAAEQDAVLPSRGDDAVLERADIDHAAGAKGCGADAG